MTKTPSTIPFLVLNSKWTEGLSMLKFLAEQDPGFEFNELNDGLEETLLKLKEYQNEMAKYLVLKALRHKEDMAEIVEIGKWLKKEKIKHIKLVVIDYVKKDNVIKILQKLDIRDLIDPNLNEKSLKYKIDLWAKAIVAPSINSQQSQDSQAKNLQKKEVSGQESQEVTLIRTPSEDREDDCWFFKSPKECKKALGKWIVKMQGPSSAVASWQETEFAGARCFEFILKGSWRAKLLPSEGHWYYFGDNKPDWDWRDCSWLFSGKEIKLQYDNDGIYSEKFHFSHDKAELQENSSFMQTRYELLEETFDPELVVNNKAKKFENLQGEGKTDNLSSKNLQGEIKSEKSDDGPLKGKSSTDEFTDNLYQLKKDPYNSGPLLDTDAKNERLKTHWKNHNSYKEENKETADLHLEGLSISLDMNQEDPVDIEVPKIKIIINFKNFLFEAQMEDYFENTATLKIPYSHENFQESEIHLKCEHQFKLRHRQCSFNSVVLNFYHDDDKVFTFLELECPEEHQTYFLDLIETIQVRQENVVHFLKKAQGF